MTFDTDVMNRVRTMCPQAFYPRVPSPQDPPPGPDEKTYPQAEGDRIVQYIWPNLTVVGEFLVDFSLVVRACSGETWTDFLEKVSQQVTMFFWRTSARRVVLCLDSMGKAPAAKAPLTRTKRAKTCIDLSKVWPTREEVERTMPLSRLPPTSAAYAAAVRAEAAHRDTQPDEEEEGEDDAGDDDTGGGGCLGGITSSARSSRDGRVRMEETDFGLIKVDGPMAFYSAEAQQWVPITVNDVWSEPNAKEDLVAFLWTHFAWRFDHIPEDKTLVLDFGANRACPCGCSAEVSMVRAKDSSRVGRLTNSFVRIERQLRHMRKSYRISSGWPHGHGLPPAEGELKIMCHALGSINYEQPNSRLNHSSMRMLCSIDGDVLVTGLLQYPLFRHGSRLVIRRSRSQGSETRQTVRGPRKVAVMCTEYVDVTRLYSSALAWSEGRQLLPEELAVLERGFTELHRLPAESSRPRAIKRARNGGSSPPSSPSTSMVGAAAVPFPWATLAGGAGVRGPGASRPVPVPGRPQPHARGQVAHGGEFYLPSSPNALSEWEMHMRVVTLSLLLMMGGNDYYEGLRGLRGDWPLTTYEKHRVHLKDLVRRVDGALNGQDSRCTIRYGICACSFMRLVYWSYIEHRNYQGFWNDTMARCFEEDLAGGDDSDSSDLDLDYRPDAVDTASGGSGGGSGGEGEERGGPGPMTRRTKRPRDGRPEEPELMRLQRAYENFATTLSTRKNSPPNLNALYGAMHRLCFVLNYFANGCNPWVVVPQGTEFDPRTNRSLYGYRVKEASPSTRRALGDPFDGGSRDETRRTPYSHPVDLDRVELCNDVDMGCSVVSTPVGRLMSEDEVNATHCPVRSTFVVCQYLVKDYAELVASQIPEGATESWKETFTAHDMHDIMLD